MAAQVFQVSPLDSAVYGIAGLVMVVVASVAAYVPAYRATATDPRAALE